MRLVFATLSIMAATTGTAGAEGTTTFDWKPCAETQLTALQCATLTVPRDYDNPSVGTFDLSVARAPATGTADERIGTLFINPGGPGESGLDVLTQMLPHFSEDVRRRFDLASWDPRGVHRSNPLSDCDNGSYRLPDTGPVNWTEITRQMRDSTRAANEACIKRYPDVVPYLGTTATTQDLDRLRAAAGDEKLTFWGTSYGTRIGYTYSQMFPGKLRALLLSSPVDPNATWASFSHFAALSPDTATGFMFQARPTAGKHFFETVAALEKTPLVLPSGHHINHWLLRAVITAMAHSEEAFGDAEAFIDMVRKGLDGDTVALAKLDETDWVSTFPVNGGAIAFVGCEDYTQRLNAEEQDQLAARIRAQAPIAGWLGTQALFYCEGIPKAHAPVPVDFVDKETPVMVIGSTRDGLTHFGWAVDVARNFRNSRLVTYVGAQHTPYLGASSTCIDRYGADFLVKLNLPTTDVSCPFTNTSD